MEDKKNYENLIKVVLKHERLIEALAKASHDVTKLMSRMLARCLNPKCGRPATMHHKLHHGNIMCDRCCAEVIVNSKKCIADTEFMNEIGAELREKYMCDADETQWEDITDAESIRRIMEYIDIVKSLQETH